MIKCFFVFVATTISTICISQKSSQQVKSIVDILYYYGDGNNITDLSGSRFSDISEGYSYEFINSDALINLISVKDEKLIAPSGICYRILVLDSNVQQNISLLVLRKIAEFVKKGIIIAGVEPDINSGPSENNKEFVNLIKEIWCNGNPKVNVGKSLKDLLSSLNIQNDSISQQRLH